MRASTTIVLGHIQSPSPIYWARTVYLHVTGCSDRTVCWTSWIRFHEEPESFLHSMQTGPVDYKILYSLRIGCNGAGMRI
jgi:hypothetical protein